MAIRPEDEWVGQSAPANANYPEGSFVDDTAPGSNDGTPVVALWINDIYGFLQKLLDAAGITPSGSPDTVVASDYFDALDAAIAAGIAAGGGAAAFDTIVVGSPVGGVGASGEINAEGLFVDGVRVLTTDDEGAGNGLDADLLDGQHGAYYQDSSNQNAGTLPDARFPATLPVANGSNLTDLDADELATGTVDPARLKIATGSFTTASLAAGTEDNRSIAHGLGTNNIMVIARGSGSSISVDWRCIVRYFDGTFNASSGEINSISSNIAIVSTPASGEFDIFTENTSGGNQTITVNWLAIALD